MAVIFDENPIAPSRAVSAKRSSFLTKLIIKTGIVKTEAGAQIALLIIALVVVALWLYVGMASNVVVEPPSAEEIIVE